MRSKGIFVSNFIENQILKIYVSSLTFLCDEYRLGVVEGVKYNILFVPWFNVPWHFECTRVF